MLELFRCGIICSWFSSVIFNRFDLPSERSVAVRESSSKTIYEVVELIMRKNGYNISNFVVNLVCYYDFPTQRTLVFIRCPIMGELILSNFDVSRDCFARFLMMVYSVCSLRRTLLFAWMMRQLQLKTSILSLDRRFTLMVRYFVFISLGTK